ncbi:MAG: hypothetical protein ACYTHJ_12210, partial [Planctomycetota bacterium]
GNDCNQNNIPDDCEDGCAECETESDCNDDDACTIDLCVDGGCAYEDVVCGTGEVCDSSDGCVDCCLAGECIAGCD